MTDYFGRLARRSGIEAMTPGDCEPANRTPLIEAVLEQHTEVETTPPHQDQPGDNSTLHARRDALDGAPAAREDFVTASRIPPAEALHDPIVETRLHVEARPHEEPRFAYARNLSTGRSVNSGATMRSSRPPEQAAGSPAAERWNATVGAANPGTVDPSTRSIGQEVGTKSAREPANKSMENKTVSIIRPAVPSAIFDESSRLFDGGLGPARGPANKSMESETACIIRPAAPAATFDESSQLFNGRSAPAEIESTPIDRPAKPTAPSDKPVEVQIGAITIQVTSPNLPAAPATKVRRDGFAPYRHYLRAW